MNASVALQAKLKTIEVSALISCTCIASICHVYMKFSLKIYQGQQSLYKYPMKNISRTAKFLAKLKILPGL
jgi:hypothetical protein